jgi:hypothetical protein
MAEENNNLPKHEAEFFLMRQAKLPSRMIGNTPHEQTIQINCNLFTDESAEDALDRVRRMEALVEKLQAYHEAKFIETMIESTKTRMTSEMDVLAALQQEAKVQGRMMKPNRKDMMSNLPAQVEKTKQQLGVLQAELEARQAIAKDLL